MQGDDDGKIELAGGKLHNPFRVIKVTNPPGLAYQWNFTDSDYYGFTCCLFVPRMWNCLYSKVPMIFIDSNHGK